MNTHSSPCSLKTATWAAICLMILVIELGCSEIFAVDDECNVDVDCKSRGENLRCESHLCVTIEQSQNDTGTDTNIEQETETETGSGEAPESATIWYRYQFTESFDGFLGPDYTHNADNGTAELTDTFQGPNEERPFEKSYGRADWSNVVDINAIVRVDEFTSGDVQLFIKSGVAWMWCSKLFDFRNLTDWTTITIEPAFCGGSVDMTVLRTIGVQVTSGTEDVGKQSVHAEIDEVYVRHIVPKDTDTDTKSNDE